MCFAPVVRPVVCISVIRGNDFVTVILFVCRCYDRFNVNEDIASVRIVVFRTMDFRMQYRVSFQEDTKKLRTKKRRKKKSQKPEFFYIISKMRLRVNCFLKIFLIPVDWRFPLTFQLGIRPRKRFRAKEGVSCRKW